MVLNVGACNFITELGEKKRNLWYNNLDSKL